MINENNTDDESFYSIQRNRETKAHKEQLYGQKNGMVASNYLLIIIFKNFHSFVLNKFSHFQRRYQMIINSFFMMI